MVLNDRFGDYAQAHAYAGGDAPAGGFREGVLVAEGELHGVVNEFAVAFHRSTGGEVILVAPLEGGRQVRPAGVDDTDLKRIAPFVHVQQTTGSKAGGVTAFAVDVELSGRMPGRDDLVHVQRRDESVDVVVHRHGIIDLREVQHGAGNDDALLQRDDVQGGDRFGQVRVRTADHGGIFDDVVFSSCLDGGNRRIQLRFPRQAGRFIGQGALARPGGSALLCPGWLRGSYRGSGFTVGDRGRDR